MSHIEGIGVYGTAKINNINQDKSSVTLKEIDSNLQNEIDTNTIFVANNTKYYVKTVSNNSYELHSINGLSSGSSITIYTGAALSNFSHVEGAKNITVALDKYAERQHAEGSRTLAAGYASHTEGNYTRALGTASHSEGEKTEASGNISHAEGFGSRAVGEESHAEGHSTQATGGYSHTEGWETVASGIYSHAEGYSVTASGFHSHAEGCTTTASGESSHTEGYNTQATNQGDHAEGISTEASGGASHAEGKGTKATGGYSHSEGLNSTATKQSSHAEGEDTHATGKYSHSEGYSNTASGEASHVEGKGNTASGDYSHAGGRGTKATKKAQTAIGKYNIENASALFIVGNGESDTERSNAFEVYEDGTATLQSQGTHNNAVVIKSELDKKPGQTTTSTDGKTLGEIFNIYSGTDKNQANGEASHAEGKKTRAKGNCSHTEGYDTEATIAAHAEGYQTKASGQRSHAEGTNTQATGQASHAEGNNTEATGQGSHAEGVSTQALQGYSHSEGYGTKSVSVGSHSEGRETIAGDERDPNSKTYAHAEGYLTQALGQASHAEGRWTIARGDCSHAEGVGYQNGNTISYSYAYSIASHAEGFLTQAGILTTDSETHNYAAAHAEGHATKATSKAAHSEGIGTEASAEASHAGGAYTKAAAYAQTAIGKYNTENINALFVIGNGTAKDKRSNAFRVDASGAVSYQTTASTNNADYAEYFEWLDGNENNEDRIGLVVTLDGNKIKLANSDDDIVGIISGTAAVLGDSYEEEWNKKYLTDSFGRIIYDMVEEFTDTYTSDGIIKESLGFFSHPRLNPDYDATQPYISRKDRPEWSPVGLVGKLYVRDDGTCEVGKYVKVKENGIVTLSTEKTNMRMLSRSTDDIIRVLLK